MKPAGLFKFRLPLDAHAFGVMINIYSIYIILILADKSTVHDRHINNSLYNTQQYLKLREGDDIQYLMKKKAFNFLLNEIKEVELTNSNGGELRSFGPWNLTQNCLMFVLHNGT
jgi:hypothetical protein